MHADWAHLLGNLVFLLIFGLPAERVMGPWRLCVLFLVGGAVANLATVLVIDTPDRLVIGASGAVSALIGTYLALFPRAHLGVVLPLGLFLEFVRAPAPLLIGIWPCCRWCSLHRTRLRRGGLVGARGRIRLRVAFALVSRGAIARRFGASRLLRVGRGFGLGVAAGVTGAGAGSDAGAGVGAERVPPAGAQLAPWASLRSAASAASTGSSPSSTWPARPPSSPSAARWPGSADSVKPWAGSPLPSITTSGSMPRAWIEVPFGV